VLQAIGVCAVCCRLGALPPLLTRLQTNKIEDDIFIYILVLPVCVEYCELCVLPRVL